MEAIIVGWLINALTPVLLVEGGRWRWERHAGKDAAEKVFIASIDNALRHVSLEHNKKDLFSKETREKFHAALCSPKIDLEKINPILASHGITGSEKNKIAEEIQLVFLAEIEKEAKKNPDVFRSVILNRINELLEEQKKLGNLPANAKVTEAQISAEIKKIFAENDEKYLLIMKEIANEIHEIEVQINEQYGLNLLSPKYFEDNKSTDNWKSCFPFELPDIKAGLEFRRSITAEIKTKLEENKVLVLVGERGTGKSVILQEIICDYFEKGYQILYDFSEELKNPERLQKFLQSEVDLGENVLVAIDNAHLVDKAASFKVLQGCLSYGKCEKVRCIIAATLPEFDALLNKKLCFVPEGYRESMRLFRDKGYAFRYVVPYFSFDEVNAFVKKYESSADSNFIFEDTKGHPILVFWRVFGQGLELDVERKYETYLTEKGEPVKEKIVTTLICSILDIADNGATEEMLEEMNLTEYARTLAVLYRREKTTWNTLHSEWARQFLRYLYPSDSEGREIPSQNKIYLQKALDKIFDLKNNNLTNNTIDTMYQLGSNPDIPIKIVEEIVKIPSYISRETQVNLYTLSIGPAYSALGQFEIAIHFFNEALKLNPECADAWYNKGLTLVKDLCHFEKALECFDKAIEINPNCVEAWDNKGVTLGKLGLLEKALKCHEKAIEINPKYAEAWFNKGVALDSLGRFKKALKCYAKGIKINRKWAEAWFAKGLTLGKLGLLEKALKCYDKAIEINPKYADAWYDKGVTLGKLGLLEKALKCYDKAIEINPKYAYAWHNKGLILGRLGLFEKELECSKKAIDVNPKDAIFWFNKAFAEDKLCQSKNATISYRKFIDLAQANYPQNVDYSLQRINQLEKK